MKLKAKQKLRSQTITELTQELGSAQTELTQLRLKISVSKHKDVRAAGKTRHRIAVLKTIIKEKELVAQNESINNRTKNHITKGTK